MSFPITRTKLALMVNDIAKSLDFPDADVYRLVCAVEDPSVTQVSVGQYVRETCKCPLALASLRPRDTEDPDESVKRVRFARKFDRHFPFYVNTLEVIG